MFALPALLLLVAVQTLAAQAASAQAASAQAAAQAASAFGFEDVAQEAAALARAPYSTPPRAAPELAALSYDDHRRIRYRPERALWRNSGLPWQAQFFHAGRGFTQALRLYEVVDGQAKPLLVPRDAFNSEGLPLPAQTTIAGLRLTSPFVDGQQWDEVIAFLGSSYFRAIGAGQRYGISARGLAVDTVGGNGEEFPAFTSFWLERPAAGAATLVLHALLDSPRVAGAYRFAIQPGHTTTVDVQARLYLRAPVAMLGIAPLSSMFLSGENQPASGDFRPEVHDSDGLQLALASGEWLWRPLSNPRGTFVTSFATPTTPRGFGILQRDRNFSSYEDLEAHYERRPSVWIEPLSDWGAGRVELLQFQTPDETHDNIAAYWVPAQLPATGQPVDMAWRLHWAAQDVPRPAGAMVLQTRAGHGWRDGVPAPGAMQLHVDFDDPAAVTAANKVAVSGAVPAAVEPRAVVGTVDAVATGNDNVRGLRAIAQSNAGRGGWRVTLDFERIDPRQPIELRAYLRRGGQALSETWSYAIAAEP